MWSDLVMELVFVTAALCSQVLTISALLEKYPFERWAAPNEDFATDSLKEMLVPLFLFVEIRWGSKRIEEKNNARGYWNRGGINSVTFENKGLFEKSSVSG